MPSSPERRVAVVVPLGRQETLSPEEETSLRHLTRFLDRYDKVLVLPASSRFTRPELTPRYFHDRFFGSVAGHTRLMLSREFYQAFADYEFILIYHLDALVFSDELLAWCDAGYDFIGPPWLKSVADPAAGFGGVGNGGFSLRRVEAFLRVFDSGRPGISPAEYWRKYLAPRPPLARLLATPQMLAKRFTRFNNVRREARGFASNEDLFWSRRAPRYDPDFRVAPIEEGLRFGFERAPRLCFERNGRRLPFGCHAWARYDRAFWEPYLLR